MYLHGGIACTLALESIWDVAVWEGEVAERVRGCNHVVKLVLCMEKA